MYGIPEISTLPQTRGEEAYQRVRERIVQGQFLPGQWLRKRTLASDLNMSPTPIVEALRRLEQEGLVELAPQWGARVKAWTVDELFEAFKMREALEGLVARECAQHTPAEQIEALRPLARRLDAQSDAMCEPDQARTLTRGDYNPDDWQFHRALAAASGLRMVAREIERLQLLQTTCRVLVVPALVSAITHVQILDAVASRDADQAERVMRQSIRESADQAVPLLREKFGKRPITFDLKIEST